MCMHTPQKTRNKYLIKKQEKERLMSLADRPLPKDFNQWLDKYVWKNRHKLIFRKDSKSYIGHCQCCNTGNLILTGKVLNGKPGRCPNCGKKIIFRNEKLSSEFGEKEYVSYLDRVENGFMLRTFQVEKWTSNKKYSYLFDERQREYWTLTRIELSQFYNQMGSFGWRNGIWQNMYQTLPDMTYVYPRNLTRLLNIPAFKYSALKQHVLQTKTSPIAYMQEWQRLPQLEILTKLKLSKLIVDILCRREGYRNTLDITQHTIKGFLKLQSKEYIRFAVKNNPSLSELESLQYMETQRVRPTIQLMRFVKECVLRHVNLETADTIVSVFGLESLHHYAKRQGLDKAGLYFINDYMDYYRACIFLKYNMSDTMFLKPKNFKAAHDRACDLQTQMQNKALYSKVEGILSKQISLFDYQGSQFSIITPRQALDIIHEGKTLGHCVGNYVNRIPSGNTVILFVRKTDSPDQSFCTLELNPRRNYEVVQCRGFKNNPVPEQKEVNKFIDTWLTKIALPKIAAQTKVS